jgi:hypothetical protein
MTHAMYLRALGLWARTPNPSAWLAPYAHADDALPGAALLTVRARGRASLLTRMFAEVLEQVTATEPELRGSLPMITSALLSMMNEEDGAVSPARFQASVHNSAAGQLSIVSGNRGFSTCIAAGRATVAACLEEASAYLAIHGGEVIVAMADESTPDFLASRSHIEPLAFALRLSATADPACVRIELSNVATDAATDATARTDASQSMESPIALGLPLCEALLEKRCVELRLTPPDAWPCYARIEHRACQ